MWVKDTLLLAFISIIISCSLKIYFEFYFYLIAVPEEVTKLGRTRRVNYFLLNIV